MAMTTVNSTSILTQAQIAELLVAPVEAMSIAAQVARVVTITAGTFRIPVVGADPSAQWVNEGEEIPPSDATINEVEVTPAKLAGLTIITRELANDSSPAAAEVVGQGLARDIARKLDQAFFGSVPAPAPAGLGALASAEVQAPAQWADADPFTGAVFLAESANTMVRAWVAHPTDAMQLSQLKEATGSNRALLQPDATAAGRRTVSGIPLLTSPYVTEGTVWGLDGEQAMVVIREDAEVETDRSVFFTSDRVAVRGIMRVGFAFPNPNAVVKITRAAA